MEQEAKGIWRRLHRMTCAHGTRRRRLKPRERQTDRLTDTANVGKNSLHLMHSMQPKQYEIWRIF